MGKCDDLLLFRSEVTGAKEYVCISFEGITVFADGRRYIYLCYPRLNPMKVNK